MAGYSGWWLPGGGGASSVAARLAASPKTAAGPWFPKAPRRTRAACKPSSVRACLATRPPRPFLLGRDCSRPPAAYPRRRRTGRPLGSLSRDQRRCMALHVVGFGMPRESPRERWALTPPFHPCLSRKPSLAAGHRRCVFCATVPRGEWKVSPPAHAPGGG